MTTFIRLLSSDDKEKALTDRIESFRRGGQAQDLYEATPEDFSKIPGSPFAYWITSNVRGAFSKFPRFNSGRITACITNPAGNDNTRYLRAWWEIGVPSSSALSWRPIAKGGRFSPYYHDVHLVVAWNRDRETYFGYIGVIHRPMEKPASVEFFFRSGITWPSRTQEFGPRILPAGCVFTGKGPAAFDHLDDPTHLLAVCAIMNSAPFKALVGTRLNAADSTARSFEVGIIQKTPSPPLEDAVRMKLADLARRSWSIRYSLDTFEETSHAFLLPAGLPAHSGNALSEAARELTSIQSEIDSIAFEVYGFTDVDRSAIRNADVAVEGERMLADADASEEDPEEVSGPPDQTTGILSWVVGVAFGRFDWRLATGERSLPSSPGPFDQLPTKSPGMLPNGADPFHAHSGILVDDKGHTHDLARLIEEVLSRIQMPVPDDVRRWLQRDFFAFHLQRYSKSRRKAPIYWPLSTSSGSYTLWVYYSSLTDQTLYTAINDFVEPKLKQIGDDVAALRNKGTARMRDDERQFESLQSLELELIQLRDTLLKLAPTFKPNHDDGVQITAAPLWPLFRHKPWQKILKETWTKLEMGDYDWAHLAMNYWPDRVREKCKNDRSRAIAHGLEDLYIAPKAQPKKPRGKKKAEVGE